VSELQAALEYLSDEWKPGPDLPDYVLAALPELSKRGLIEKRFADVERRETECENGNLRVNIRACWWFRAAPRAKMEATNE
jgi:hypothetical protein